jgi:hypothetical protein
MTMKSALGVGIAVIVALGAGWLWGSSGRRATEHALQVTTLQEELTEGHDALLAARLDIYSVNFGEASRHFESSRTSLTRAIEHLKNLDRADDAARIQGALTGLADAQRLAGNLDQNANSRTAEVAKLVADVIAKLAADLGTSPPSR